MCVLVPALLGTALAGAAAAAEPEAPADAARVEELEQKVDVVVEELDRLRKSAAVPLDGKLESYSGLGPAASKVYHRDRGLSLGGYGEVRFRGQVADTDGSQDVFDALRMVLYAGYKFNDWIVFNSELEFEHGGTSGGGSVSAEFVTVDFLLSDPVNVRAGLLLVPMGFINEMHEPLFFHGAARPEVERQIIPSTWRENGAGIFGSIGDVVDYRLYAVNGFDATGFSDAGLRGGRQKGSEALADHFAFVGRVDVKPAQGVLLGASVYTGKSGQNQDFTRDISGTPTTFAVPDARTTIWEVHGQAKRGGAHLRGLWTQAHVEDSAALGAALGRTIARRMVGGYVEVAYDVLPMLLPDTEMALEPFYRFEHLDTQDRVVGGPRNAARDRDLHVIGVHFEPHPQVVLKLDYRNIDSAAGDLPDEVQVGLGFVF